MRYYTNVYLFSLVCRSPSDFGKFKKLRYEVTDQTTKEAEFD